ncbi:putative bifunctional diguanylate cyclase/phosphodiesterase [Pigmentiphaga litoralis]|uniref:putative bifunctional diguanylate cyclase/phosphodiesterase n=1 Tax=Pigmentiphaga litoralis TaxID=516702 RepID=UPI003B427B84
MQSHLQDVLSPPLAALEQAIDFLARIDARGRFTYVSEPGLAFIGYHREYLKIVTLSDLVPANELAILNATLERVRLTGDMQRCTLHLVKTLTYPQLVELRILPDVSQPGEWLVVAQDMSAWAAKEERLTYEMHHDALTGLDNLASARREIERAKHEANVTESQFALLLIDIDEYCRVNQAFGYEAGDLVLAEIATRLKSAVHAREFVARCDSDSFLVLLRNIPGRAYVQEVARRISDAILQPYTHHGQNLQLSIKIGAVVFPDAANDNGQLLRLADEAIVQARKEGASSFAFYAPYSLPARTDTLKLESDMHNGIRNGEFSLHYQPIYDPFHDSVVGIEALMRWQHPVHGAVPPGVFIPLAESAGLIGFLGDWALRNACMQLMQWDRLGIHLQYASVNVSAQQFRDTRFPSVVRDAVTLTGISPRRIVLEITESVLMHDPLHAKRLLEDLTALGIRFAVDDFGTGYSSLAYLQSFPLATLKIDRRFITDLPTSRNDQAIVDAVVGLARTLELQLVAEGVETQEQLGMLTARGCHLIQGWLICKALPSAELTEKFQQGMLRTQKQ